MQMVRQTMVQLFQLFYGDRMKKIHYFFLMSFIVFSSNNSFSENICVPRLEIGNLYSLPNGASPWFKFYDLRNVKFFTGHPKELGLLKMDDIAVQQEKGLSVKLDETQEYWVLCNYSGLDFSIVKKLGQVSACKIDYLNGHVTNFECR